MVLGCKSFHKPGRIFPEFSRISIGLCGFKVNLHPLTEISAMASVTPKSCYVTKKGRSFKFLDHDNSYLMILSFAVTHANTAQKMKFSIKDFFSKCDQIRSFLRIWSNLLKKSFMENFIFCAV